MEKSDDEDRVVEVNQDIIFELIQDVLFSHPSVKDVSIESETLIMTGIPIIAIKCTPNTNVGSHIESIAQKYGLEKCGKHSELSDSKETEVYVVYKYKWEAFC